MIDKPKKTKTQKTSSKKNKSTLAKIFDLFWHNEEFSLKHNPFIMYLGILVFSIILDFFIPSNFMLNASRRAIGIIFIFAGGVALFLVASAIVENKINISLNYKKVSIKYVKTGIYKYSRNPAYLSLIVIAVGLGFAANNLWMILFQIPFFMILARVFVPKEEEAFKDISGYSEYCKKVRRWL